MASTKPTISEHHIVVLRTAVGAWPTGATGAVVSAYDDTLLVEIAGTGGKTLDTIQVPAAQLADKHGRSAAPARRRPIRLLVQALIAKSA